MYKIISLILISSITFSSSIQVNTKLWPKCLGGGICKTEAKNTNIRDMREYQAAHPRDVLSGKAAANSRVSRDDTGAGQSGLVRSKVPGSKSRQDRNVEIVQAPKIQEYQASHPLDVLRGKAGANSRAATYWC